MAQDNKGILRKFAEKFTAKVYTAPDASSVVTLTKADVARFNIPKNAQITGRVLSNAEIKELFNSNIPYEGRYLLVQIFGEGPELTIKEEIPVPSKKK